jgi:glycosyltransferase involved in cell wall biosynthesis
VLEAMACGRPVIVSDYGAMQEAVLNGINGMVIRRGDLDDLVSAMETFLRNRESMRRMAAESRRRAEAHYDPETRGRRVEAFYIKLQDRIRRLSR